MSDEQLPAVQPSPTYDVEVQALPPDALGMLERAAVDGRIATAKRFRRSLTSFRQRVTDLVRLSPEVAASCYYSLSRRNRDGGSNKIEGASIRFAEMLATAYGNIDIAGSVVSQTGEHVVAMGRAIDLESNTTITRYVLRRITDRNGRRFSDDMIAVTGNAGASIAMRNAILSLIPKGEWEPVLEIARKTARGDEKALGTMRAQAIQHFEKLGVPADRVYAALGRAGIDDVTIEDVETLRGLITAINEGHTSLAEAFPKAGPPEQDDRPRTQKLKDELAARQVQPKDIGREPKA